MLYERAFLDLKRYHARHQHGDITVFLTWYADDGGPRPCLVLVPSYAISNARSVPCVVPLTEAWAWDEKIGDGRYAARTAAAFAQTLGMSGSMQNAIRVRSMIVDHIGDLVAMPPMPDAMRENVVLGEAKITAREADKVIRHHEIVERT